MSEASEAINKFRGQVEPARPVLTGWMVDHEGIGSARVTSRPGYVYVLVDRGEAQASGDVVEVWCRFRPVAGWPVRIGTTRDRDWEYSVLSIDDEALGGAIDGKPVLEHHSEMHQWCDPSGGDDVVYPRFLQLYDFAVWPGGGLSVNVQDGVYEPYCVTRGLSYTNLDLTAYKPGSGLRYVTIALSPTGTFEIVPGTIQAIFLDLDDIPPAPSAEHWRLAAVRLRSTDTEIVNTCAQTNIVDLRFARLGWPITLTADADDNLLGFDNCHRLDLDTQPSGTFFAANPSASSKPYFRHIELSDLPPFVNPDWENVIVVAKSGGDYDTIQAAINAASTGDAILIMPGTYTENLTINKDITLVGLSRREVIVGGEISCTLACALETFTLSLSASSAADVEGIDVGSLAGGTRIDSLFIDIINTGGGDAYGIKLNHSSGTVYVTHCYVSGAAGGGGSGYGISHNGTGTTRIRFCYLDSSHGDLMAPGSGWCYSASNVLGNNTMGASVSIEGGPLYVDGVTRTVGSGKEFSTIQDAIDWFDRRIVYGACIIDVDAGTYDEAIVFPDLVLAVGASLTLQGDTRALAGLSYVDGAAGNQAGLTNGGSGVVTLSNAGAVITVACATTNPDFDADGWDSGDKIQVYDNTGTTAEYTIDSVSNNTITLTVAAPAVGNDATAIRLLPDRRIERTSAGPCVQVDTVRGVAVDGFYLESSTGSQCDGIYVLNGGVVEAVRVATYAEDYGLNVLDLSMVIADGGAVSLWGASATARGVQPSRSAQAKLQYSVVNACQYGYRAYDFAFVSCPDSIAVNCSALAYSASNFSSVNAARGTARQNGTGYYASARGYVYGPNTNANNNGNGTDYSPAVSDAFGNNNGSITWS